ncbi:MAG: hypothetical protein Q7U76_13050 [Nitrospirota bacterium]|nr:hypothetical protein [Nitrospirota bacterium]
MPQVDVLNKITRGSKVAGLGTKLAALIALVNQLASVKCRTLNSAGLAIGTGSLAAVKITTATVNVLINSEFKSISTQEVAFTAVTHSIPANAASVQEAVYVLSVPIGLTPIITMGRIATGAGNAVAPSAPANHAVLGQVRIAVAAGATPFTAATTLLNAGAVTVTYTNLEMLPITAPIVDVLV